MRQATAPWRFPPGANVNNSQRPLTRWSGDVLLRWRNHGRCGFFLRWPGQQHNIFGAHLRVRLLPGSRLLLPQPHGLRVGFNFFKRRGAAGNNSIDKHQVPSVAGLDGTLPRTRLHFLESHGKLRAEFLGYGAGRAVTVVVLKHKGIAQGNGELGVLRLAGYFGQRLGGVFLSILATLVRRKVEVAEAVPAWQSELV